jgi:hypothetical protein
MGYVSEDRLFKVFGHMGGIKPHIASRRLRAE